MKGKGFEIFKSKNPVFSNQIITFNFLNLIQRLHWKPEDYDGIGATSLSHQKVSETAQLLS